tara:strand:- start:82 stop:558 length:477 start_codon:yes stop_codon:yes gene_type:complete
MKKDFENIIGEKIQKVIYTELNHPKGKFYFDDFDTFDTSINIQMQNNIWWHLSWKDDEFFEFGKGKYLKNKNYQDSEIKSWDATERWKSILNEKIIDFKVQYFDGSRIFIEKITINFENKISKNILILEELNLEESIPKSTKFDICGEIYVFHSDKLL